MPEDGSLHRRPSRGIITLAAPNNIGCALADAEKEQVKLPAAQSAYIERDQVAKSGL